MQILSALDAISPAIARTRLVLYTPFRFGRTWKLSATAYLAFAGTVFFPFTLIYLVFLPHARAVSRGAGIALISAVLVATALYIFLFYLCSRLQFAFFDIVVNRGEFIAPAWRKYGPPARLWTAIKVLAGTLLIALMAAPTAAYVRHMTIVVERLKDLTPGQAPPPDFMAGLFVGYFAVIGYLGLFFLILSTVSAFIIPSLALENVPLGEAFRRLFALIRNEPGQFFAYIVLKLGLGLAGYLAMGFVFEIVFFVVVFVVGAIGAVLGVALHAVGVPTAALIGLAIVAGVALYIALLYMGVLGAGPLFTFMQAYTLYFLGGRYPLLGELLDRSTPLPVPIVPPPGYPYGYASAPPAPRDSP